MANIINEVEKCLKEHPLILQMVSSSDGLFEIEETREKKYIKIKKNKEFDSKDKDEKQYLYDIDKCIVTMQDRSPLYANIHGVAIKDSIKSMENYAPQYDPSAFASEDDWISVTDVSLWDFDTSTYIDSSIFIPKDTIKIIFDDASVYFDSSSNLYNLNIDVIFINNMEKNKK